MSLRYFISTKKRRNKTLYRKTNWKPPVPNHKNLTNYFEKIKTDITTYKNTLPNLNLTENLKVKEKKILKRLSTNKKIEIKKSDKGGSIVIMDIKMYKEKSLEHLNDRILYQKMNNNPLNDLKTNIEAFLETIYYHYHIDKETFDFLFPPKNPRTNLFYILPKLHKPLIPGRPVVSSVNSVNEHISEFLTKCIQPLTLKLNSHIKDTKDFLKTIVDKDIANTKYLVTIDVKSLYTNIPTPEGISACIHFIRKYRDDVPSFTPNERILKTLFHFVLENNYFLLNKDLYKQKQGCAMGTKMAPPYADLFLGKFETEKILTETFKKHIKLYKRFLDDIFLLWDGTLHELNTFIEHINNVHPTIKFTHEYSEKEIEFLDTTIYIDQETNTFKSKIFNKPTNTNSLLHFSSYHPIHTKENIIQTQALRYRHLTTDNNILNTDLQQLKSNFKERGYPTFIINKNLKKIKHLNQEDTLNKRQKSPFCNKNNILKFKTMTKTKSPPQEQTPLTFVVKYCEHHTRLQKILLEHWNIIKRDSTLNWIFPKKPFIVYKRHKNLKDILTKTKFDKL